jgi:Tol biopolymer transport system component
VKAAITVMSVLTAGCGRIGFDVAGDGSGASGDGPARFGAPEIVGELDASITDDDDPCLRIDQLEMFFSSERSGAERLYRATRSTLTDPFGAPQEILAFGFSDHGPCVSRDGLEVVFDSDETTSMGAKDLFALLRPSTVAAFAPPIHLPGPSSSENDVSPSLSGDGRTLWFASDRDQVSLDIYTATRVGSAPFGAATLVSSLSTPAVETDPFPWSETTIYFSSDRAGGAGGSDLYVAWRASPTEPFSAPVMLEGVSSARDEVDPWLSPDGVTLYFVRDAVGNGNLIMRATRVP